MATLLMDVETMWAIQTKLADTYISMYQSFGNVTRDVNAIIGSSWVGNSANEFLQSYEVIRAKLDQEFENLRIINNALADEIEQWQETAARMG